MAEDPPTPPERLTAEDPERSWRGHLFRYRLARGFCCAGDTVVDAACGIGYGMEVLAPAAGDVIGVDREPVKSHLPFIEADLCEWQPDFPFDIFVGFETIEHLPDFTAYIAAAKQARRWLLLSAPIVPTVGVNPWHVHNFAPGELADLICDGDWSLWQSISQPAEVSEVYVFARR